ncbi:MAG TPA: threonine--tRNA ligase [Synergistaceae bacterium]|nr:threonine--tRNA ligase [Synergistaceae bacterium]HPJ24655.1 threonine--tRNA ligase [Synergistaceae bacterium]HPQ36150.1 threonine--tRNA ligase [Synergistaceae bacterium]
MARFSNAAGDEFDGGGMSGLEILRHWNLEKNALAVRVNGELKDLHAVIDGDVLVEPVTSESPEGLELLRHSASHLLAQAVLNLFPGTKYAIGPAIKDGFYYDFEVAGQITDEDLPKIEKEMSRLAKEKIPVSRKIFPRQEALDYFKKQDQIYKVELIEALEDQEISCYGQGDFLDLCRGPHVPHTGFLRAVKLLSLAGAYWRGDENNIMLTRIYGTAFPDKESLKAHLAKLEEAKRRAHQKLGRELDLFSLHPEGPGFPFFHPKGMVIINQLVDFWRQEHLRRGYCEIKTPLILNKDLWLRSGHWDHYRENMYFTDIDEREYAIKPMNCPGGIMVYNNRLRSYKEFPLRMAELGTVHRHERSGVLHGLMRVRCFTQDDAHLYVTPEQIKNEILGVMNLADYIYSKVFSFKYTVELSTRPEKAMGDPAMWDMAEKALQDALEESGTPYRINEGDGAFYGPKIDFHLEDCLGRTWQCGTIQLDFQMPEKFDMTYVGQDGQQHRPVMLHRTVYGSLERFFGILIEHYAGAFPFWLAPVQVKLLPVSDDHLDYTKKVEKGLRSRGYRTEIDFRDEKLGKKIRDAQMEKVPYMLVLGDREQEQESVALRERTRGDLGSKTLEEMYSLLKEEFSPFSCDLSQTMV